METKLIGVLLMILRNKTCTGLIIHQHKP